MLVCSFLPVTAAAPPFIAIEDVAVSRDDRAEHSRLALDDANWIATDWETLVFTDVVWLRAHVDVPAGFQGHAMPMGLFLNAAASAEAWWDGELIGHNGKPASNAGAEIAGRTRAVFHLDAAQLREGRHVLALRLSRQHGGDQVRTPIDALYIAPWQDPLAAERMQYLPALISGGAVALAGAFLLVMGWRGGDGAALWLSAACLALLLQLAFESLRAFVNYPYPWQDLRLIAIPLAAWLFGFSLLGFLLVRLTIARPMRWRLGLGALAVLPFALTGDAMTALVLFVFLAGSVTVAARAVRAGQRAAWPFLAALTLLLVLLSVQTLAFLDQWLYVGFALMLILFFAEHLRAHFRAVRERDAARHRAARLELDLLRQHLRPHFLMNTLTALAEWVEASPRTGVRMVHALAEEFRTLIDVADRPFISLAQELALCRAHLAVMGFRRDQAYTLDVGRLDGNPAVPPALLHTLIENAVTHGGDSPHTVLQFAAAKSNARWRLQLDCPPGGYAADDRITEGTGLAYVRARLSEAFGADWRLEQGVREDGGWFTAIDIPEREATCA